MLKKIIRNTNIIVIATIIIISSILIGSNLTEENGLLPYTIIGIYGIIYYAIEIYKKIRKLLNNMSFYVIIIKNLGGNIEWSMILE